MNILRTTNKPTLTEVETFEFEDYVCEQTKVNDVITNQVWQRNKPGFHQCNYQPERLRFYYYENLDFLDQDGPVNTIRWVYPSYAVIKDLKDFNEVDHLFAIWVEIDGNIYQIDKPYPLSVWRFKDYIAAGITNKDFNLKMAYQILRGNPNVRGVKIEDIPSYNRDEGRSKFVSFEYRLTDEQIRLITDEGLSKTDMFYPHNMNKFDFFGLSPSIKRSKIFSGED